MAVHPKDKARCCCDLVILVLYVFIPPSRGLEIRTLEIEQNWQNFNPQNYKDRNIILFKDPLGLSLHFDNYKTQKFTGHDELILKLILIDLGYIFHMKTLHYFQIISKQQKTCITMCDLGEQTIQNTT